MNFDELEIAPGFEHEHLQGLRVDDPAQVAGALEKAFDYRGDVTITRQNGSEIEGYIFDRNSSRVRLFPKNGGAKVAVDYSDIAAVAFTGRDPAAGKSWQAWVQKYFERKAAGEQNIEIAPESLDEV
jgi:hypothetical protein